MQNTTDEESSLPCEVKNYTRPSYSFYGFARVDPYLVLAMKLNKEKMEALEREIENQDTPISTAEETLVLDTVSQDNECDLFKRDRETFVLYINYEYLVGVCGF